MYSRVFNFKNIRFNKDSRSIDQETKKILFGNTIKTDGVSVDFLFYKSAPKKKGSSANMLDLSLEDFDLNEVSEKYNPIFIDPGRKSVFTATVGLEKQQVRKCPTKEYYHMTGSTAFCKMQNAQKESNGPQLIESKIPTAKTSKISKYEEYVYYILEHLDTFFGFYNFNTAKEHFNLYIGRQRAPQLMVNMLTNGTKNYNRSLRTKKKKRKEEEG
ncbi:hypothetical protein BD408DRAFT_151801 [Parasitella parasitica]|nr:hypothetical protein BD408DRAFT_151801 [Parasitella parasitica]